MKCTIGGWRILFLLGILLIKSHANAQISPAADASLSKVSPPVITSQPANQTALPTHTAAFAVTATGTALTYQWKFAGTNLLAGRTNAALSLTNVTTASAGNYSVVITNTAGSVTSSTAVLTVLTPPIISAQPAAQNVIPGNSATFSVAATGGALNYQWLDGTNHLSGQTNSTLIIYGVQAANAGVYSVTVTNLAGSVASAGAVLTLVTPPKITTQPISETVTQGSSATFSVTATGGDLSYQWFFNGSAASGQTNTTLTLNNVPSASAGCYTVVISNPAGWVASTSATLTVLIPPTITTQPASLTVNQGSNAVFSISASGSPNLSYSWWFNGTNLLAGRTNATLSLTNVLLANTGSYSAMVTNLAGTVTSTNAVLTVLAPPKITTQPASQNIVQGNNVSFSVTATGGLLRYQWKYNGTNLLHGQTNATLILANVQPANAGAYSVIVTNRLGSATSSNAVLTVFPLPTIAVPPANVAVLQGGAVTFSVSATGNQLTYQWLFNGNPLPAENTIVSVAGATSLGGGYSGDGGPATNAALNDEAGVCVDSNGNLYIADTGNNVIRRVDPTGVITTVAGNESLGAGYSGDGGAATNAALNDPNGIATDGAGNLYIAEYGNNVVRRVSADGRITTVAGNFSRGGTYAGDGGTATNAGLDSPVGIAVDGAGNLYIGDAHNNVVRKVDVNGIITTVAGNQSLGAGYSGDGGAGTNAALNYPAGVAVDDAGNLYIADSFNFVVRKVSASGTITTVAGDNSLGASYAGDGGTATNAGLNILGDVVVDGAGNLYIADTLNNVIRHVDANGIITTVAGNFSLGGSYSGDGSAATNAGLNFPFEVALDAVGNLYIADCHNNVVRQVAVGFSVNPATGTLTLTDVQPGEAGNYAVVVSDAYGSVTSSLATLTVHTPPAINVPPASQTVAQGTNVTFSVTATGGGLNYQWWFDGTNRLAGQTNYTLTLTNASMADDGGYSVTVSNLYGAIASSTAALLVVAPPIIIEEPTNETVNQFATVTLNVTATGGELGYQWWFDGNPVFGATTSSLLLLPSAVPMSPGAGTGVSVTAGGNGQAALESGSYWVVITNAAGLTMSSNAVVTIDLVQPAIITDQPTNEMVAVGSSFVLAVGATGNPVEYEWLFNGIPLAGQTNGTLALTNVTTAEAGTYSVYVGNDAGWELSSNAVLTVETPPMIVAQPANLTVVQFTTNISLTVDALGGGLNYQWFGNGTVLAGQTNATLGFTSALPSFAGSYFVLISNLAGSIASSNAVLTVLSPPVISTQPASQAVFQGSNAIFNVTATGGALKYRWRFNGYSLAQATNSSLTVLNVQNTNVGNYSVIVSNAIGSVVSSNATLTELPMIITQPASQTIAQGTLANFQVTAAGSPLNYQWYFNGVALPGATNPFWQFYVSSATNAGLYSVTITNIGGSVTSSAALLTVVSPPAIIIQPTNQIVLPGSNATFSVTATGGNLNYQWFFGTNAYNEYFYQPLVGQTNAVLSLTNVQAANVGAYFVGITNLAGIAISTNAFLTIPPIITAQPTNLTMVQGSSAYFQVTAAGAPLNYQWSFNGVPISGAINPFFYISSAASASAGVYSVTITNAGGSVTSSNVTLALIYPPTITGQPTNEFVAQGGGAVFAVAATGSNLNYQWSFAGQESGFEILPAQTNSTLTLTNVQSVNAGGYVVVITNLAGSVVSSNAALIVFVPLAPPAISRQPAGQTAVRASTATFTVSASGNSLSYQWLFDGAAIGVSNTLITTMAGNFDLGAGYSGDGAAATNAQLNAPGGVAFDGDGNLYIADTGNSLIRRVDASGTITTVAGNELLGGGYSGDGGSATNAQLEGPSGIALDATGNLYLTDPVQSLIRRVNAAGLITTVAGNSGLAGAYAGDGGDATNAALNAPTGVAVDALGNFFIADSENNVVRRVDATGTITTVAGSYALGSGYSGDGAAATDAQLDLPRGVAVDVFGNLFIADSGNGLIRRVDGNGIITTVAGNFNLGPGYSGDGAAATNARLGFPSAVAVDNFGNLLIADGGTSAIRQVNASGIITTVAGIPSVGRGFSGDAAPATNATLDTPNGIAVNAAGNPVIADTGNNIIRTVYAGILEISGTVQNGQLTLTNIQTGMDGDYQVIVSNPAGAVTSSNALLTVLASPQITVQPDGLTVPQGSNATVSVTAIGGELNYQWWFNGTNVLSGQTNATLALTNFTTANMGNYRVVITNPYGTATSSNAFLMWTTGKGGGQ